MPDLHRIHILLLLAGFWVACIHAEVPADVNMSLPGPDDQIVPSEKNALLPETSDYHQMRGGLRNCPAIFETEKQVRVAFLGGSITHNPGWRDSVYAWFEARFPETDFDFIAAGIPSMGSTPSAFRLDRDVLSKGKVDLLFVEAAVNDATNGRSASEQLRALEGIVRKSRRSNPYMDLVIMHFVDPQKMDSYRSGEVPEVIQNHNRVADYYQIPTLNLAREVTERIDRGEFTWEDDFKDLHPSPFGQGIYARSIGIFLDSAFTRTRAGKHGASPYPLPDPMDPYCYENGSLLAISAARWKTCWRVDPRWNPGEGSGTRANYVHVPMLICEEPGNYLTLKFRGHAVGMAIAAGPDAGIIAYRVDGGSWKTRDLFTRWSPHLHLPWYLTLEAEQDAGDHLLELRLTRDRNEDSQGTACRIRYFYVNE